MKFLAIRSYDNYIPAHLAMGRLKEEGIQGWLKDENTVTIDPLLANALGGIKLMVAANESEKATAILDKLERKHAAISCPNCRSANIDLASTPRRLSNWISTISAFFFKEQSNTAGKEYHCFDCKHEFSKPIRTNAVTEDESGFSS